MRKFSDRQIKALRAEAAAAGDERQVWLCDAALFPRMGREAAWADAREACEQAISEAKRLEKKVRK